jgi:hypothetical protein
LNHLFLSPKIPTAAAVPRIVAIIVVSKARTNVFFRASIAAVSLSISAYHLREKPVNLDVELLSLNEKKNITPRGKYIIKNIIAR